jgi:hypothetical protein
MPVMDFTEMEINEIRGSLFFEIADYRSLAAAI